jgi:hypothetical protein
MQMPNAHLTDDDLRSLRALRTTRVRGAPTPSVPVKIAGRLGGLGLMRPQVIPGMLTGGMEITESGMAELDRLFLFCRATGCDGILRRWALLDEPGPHPQLTELRANGRRLYTLRCSRCGSINRLTAKSHPRHRSDYVFDKVITPEPRSQND